MDTNVAPAVSVVLPVYNAAAYLKEAINSMLAQTFTSFELILLNDGSTDDCAEIVARYAEKDPRIKTITHTQNKGLIATLNEGFSLAQGRYIARMDADDISFPQRLERQVHYLDTHPGCFCVGTWYAHYPSGKVQKLATEDFQIKVDVLRYNPLAHPTVMLRKETWMQQGLQYEATHKHVEDLALWLNCMRSGLTFANIPEVLLHYRRHTGQVSEVHLRHQEEAALALRATYLAHLAGVAERTDSLATYLDTRAPANSSSADSFVHLSEALTQYAIACKEPYQTAWMQFLREHYVEKISRMTREERKMYKSQWWSSKPKGMTWKQKIKLYYLGLG
jgi:glycosyltransferase involved in cell wall biosynthesis